MFRSITPPSGFTCAAPPVDGRGTVTCVTSSMALSRDPLSFTLVVRVLPDTSDGEEITNTATVISEACDKDPSSNSAMVKTKVEVRADLAVTKTGVVDQTSRDRLNPRLIYTVTVTNKGGCSDAKNVRLVDQIAENLQFLPNLSTGASCRELPSGKRMVICDLAEKLAPGESRTVKLIFQVSTRSSNPTVCNRISVASDTLDRETRDNFAIARIDLKNKDAANNRPRNCKIPVDDRTVGQ